ncbi:MAG: tetratricopeptide repeat protein, partial [Nitrospirales bacterium]
NAMAQYELGLLYANGEGMPQDYLKAREWYEKAAIQGVVMAQTNLGALYHNGQGVRQEYATARQWWEQAAAQGHETAQHNLGVLYEKGRAGHRIMREHDIGMSTPRSKDTRVHRSTSGYCMPRDKASHGTMCGHICGGI